VLGQDQPGRHCHSSDYDSVDMCDGELVVLDSRAVLPCFLDLALASCQLGPSGSAGVQPSNAESISYKKIEYYYVLRDYSILETHTRLLN
jgi:hypothetical protein